MKQYLNQLIERATESAIRQQPKAQVRNLRSVLAAAAAIALLIAGAGITYHLHSTSAEPLMAQQTASPLDSFLDSLSDDEAELANFKKRKYQYMAKDREGRDVFLADSGYVLSMAQEDFKHIKFHFTSEF